MMDRRSFLKWLGLAPAAAVVVPEVAKAADPAKSKHDGPCGFDGMDRWPEAHPNSPTRADRVDDMIRRGLLQPSEREVAAELLRCEPGVVEVAITEPGDFSGAELFGIPADDYPQPRWPSVADAKPTPLTHENLVRAEEIYAELFGYRGKPE